MIGKKVYIQDLDQLGLVRSMAGEQVETVEVQTPDGPKLVNVLEKGYKVISLVLAILQLLLKFFGK
jgi:hypothetical protein